MIPFTDVEYKFHEASPHWLYDLSIEDLEERKEKRVLFPAAHKAANFLGVTPRHVYNNRARGSKIFSPRFNSWFVIRIATNENNNEQKNSTR